MTKYICLNIVTTSAYDRYGRLRKISDSYNDFVTNILEPDDTRDTEDIIDILYDRIDIGENIRIESNLNFYFDMLLFDESSIINIVELREILNDVESFEDVIWLKLFINRYLDSHDYYTELSDSFISELKGWLARPHKHGDNFQILAEKDIKSVIIDYLSADNRMSEEYYTYKHYLNMDLLLRDLMFNCDLIDSEFKDIIDNANWPSKEIGREVKKAITTTQGHYNLSVFNRLLIEALENNTQFFNIRESQDERDFVGSMLDLIEDLISLRNGIQTLLGYNLTRRISWAVNLNDNLTAVDFINKYLSKIGKTLLDYMDDPIDTFRYFNQIMHETIELGYKIERLEIYHAYSYKRVIPQGKEKPVFMGYVKYTI